MANVIEQLDEAVRTYQAHLDIIGIKPWAIRSISKFRRPLIFVESGQWTYAHVFDCLPYISRVPVEIRFTSAVPRGNYEKYRRQFER